MVVVDGCLNVLLIERFCSFVIQIGRVLEGTVRRCSLTQLGFLWTVCYCYY